ncbi:MAG TPA: M56 family metallopeptidase, partial [Cyclobacteriaceae bacterium]
SFFQYIFIGKNNQFTEEEQNKIIQHERAHIQLHHSLDVLFIEIVQLFFWFNPAVYRIKRFLKDVHEYQADAATVNPQETDSYCFLMARMALLSIDFPIANHFNQSQTLKRITMINSPKTKLTRIKLTMICLMSALFFVVIACQDQLTDEISEVAKNSTMAVDIPKVVSERVSFLKERNPNAELVVIELNEEGKKTFTNLEKKVKEGNNYVLFEGVDVIAGKDQDDSRRFVIFQYTSQASRIAELSSTNEVFTLVDQPAVPAMGIDQFYAMIGQQMQYPENARKVKAEGKVFIEFVVNKDGSLSDFKVAKGFNEDCDAEAIRVLTLAKNWFPGKHQGKIVRQKMVMPITFRLG